MYTEASVTSLQKRFDIDLSGVVGPTFWNKMIEYVKQNN